MTLALRFSNVSFLARFPLVGTARLGLRLADAQMEDIAVVGQVPRSPSSVKAPEV